MKKLISLLLICLFLIPAAFAEAELPTGPVADGRDRPSSAGHLQVKDGKLCGADGEPVMLRGVSSYGISMSEGFINEKLFSELSRDTGVNVFRLAMYTQGMGVMGYCNGGDQAKIKKLVTDGVEYARNQDMYAIIDWHILDDGDPNKYVEESKVFFAEMAEMYADYDNVLYEICNEPNGVDWPTVKTYAEQVIPVILEKDPDAVIICGTPGWSSQVDQAAADPLDYDCVLYTMHFYAATNYEDSRAVFRTASQAGLPLFCTEYGVTASTGGMPRDLDSANEWIEFMEEENISYCMWSFSKVAEPCSAVTYTCIKYNGFTEEDYTKTGIWLINTIKSHGGNAE